MKDMVQNRVLSLLYAHACTGNIVADAPCGDAASRKPYSTENGGSVYAVIEGGVNMNVLAGIEPERVFYFFEEISRIPHGSGNDLPAPATALGLVRRLLCEKKKRKSPRMSTVD